MSRSHLKVREFPHEVRVAAKALFAARPWSNQDDQTSIAQSFADRVTEIYGVGPVALFVDEGDGGRNTREYRHQWYAVPSLTLYGWSVTNLFAGVAEHILDSDIDSLAGEDLDVTPKQWAHSLYYSVRPQTFRRLAREGRIGGVTARDTYTSESWNRLAVAGFVSGNDLLCTDSEAWAILNEPSDADLEPDSDAIAGGQTIHPHDDEDDGLSACNRDALRRLAAENDIAGRGTMTRDQLEGALREAGVRA